MKKTEIFSRSPTIPHNSSNGTQNIQVNPQNNPSQTPRSPTIPHNSSNGTQNIQNTTQNIQHTTQNIQNTLQNNPSQTPRSPTIPQNSSNGTQNSNNLQEYKIIDFHYKTEIKHIYHFSDIHIQLFKRHSDYKEVFNNLYDYLKSEKEKLGISKTTKRHLPIVSVITGDILHSKTELSPECIDLCYNFFKNVSNIMPLIVIPGNHDLNMHNKARMDSITPILGDLTNINPIYYLLDTGVYQFNNIYFSHSSITNQFIIDPTHINTNSTINNVKKIALFHGRLDGVLLYNGTTLKDNKTITASSFDGYDIAMLGDIHKHQFLKPNVAYAGSLIQQNMGEDVDMHGLIKWDMSNNRGTFVNIKSTYAYVTLNVVNKQSHQLCLSKDSNGKHIHNEKCKLPHNLRVRILYQNTPISYVNDFIELMRVNHNIIEYTYQNDDSTHHTNNNISDNYLNITSIENQNIILEEYLKEHTNATENEIRKLKKLNKMQNDTHVEQSMRNLSNFKLLKLEFDNLFSYGINNTINFKHFNRVVGIISPNHMGKSSIIDIILYTLYDKFSRKGNIKDMINNRKDTFSIKLTIQVSDYIYVIEKAGKRTKKGSTVKILFTRYPAKGGEAEILNGDTSTKTKHIISDYFGDYEDIINTSISIQNNSNTFIDSDNVSRKKELEKILKLDFVETLISEANKIYNKNNTILKHTESNINYESIIDCIKENKLMESEIETVDSNIESAKEELVNVETTINENYKLISNDVTCNETKLDYNIYNDDVSTFFNNNTKIVTLLDTNNTKNICKLSSKYLEVINFDSNTFEPKPYSCLDCDLLKNKIGELESNVGTLDKNLELLYNNRDLYYQKTNTILNSKRDCNINNLTNIINNNITCTKLDKKININLNNPDVSKTLLDSFNNLIKSDDYDDDININKFLNIYDDCKQLISFIKYVKHFNSLILDKKLKSVSDILDNLNKLQSKYTEHSNTYNVIVNELKSKLLDKKSLKGKLKKVEKKLKSMETNILPEYLNKYVVDVNSLNSQYNTNESIFYKELQSYCVDNDITESNIKDAEWFTNYIGSATKLKLYKILSKYDSNSDSYISKIEGYRDEILSINNKLSINKLISTCLDMLDNNINNNEKIIDTISEYISKIKVIDTNNKHNQTITIELETIERKKGDCVNNIANCQKEKKTAIDTLRILKNVRDLYTNNIRIQYNIEKYNKHFLDYKTSIINLQKNKIINDNIKKLKDKNELLKTELDSMQQSKLDYYTKINSNKLKIEQYKKDSATLKKCEEKVRLNDLYRNAIKKMPYIMIKKIIPILERKINDFLILVTDFSISIDIQDIKIDIYLTRSLYGNKPIILNNCSGFEKFISSLAIRIALLEITNLPKLNFIAIDEGWSSFDVHNINNLNIIFNYLTTKFDFVLTISHLNEIKQHCDYQITLKKDKYGFSNVNVE